MLGKNHRGSIRARAYSCRDLESRRSRVVGVGLENRIPHLVSVAKYMQYTPRENSQTHPVISMLGRHLAINE